MYFFIFNSEIEKRKTQRYYLIQSASLAYYNFSNRILSILIGKFRECMYMCVYMCKRR